MVNAKTFFLARFFPYIYHPKQKMMNKKNYFKTILLFSIITLMFSSPVIAQDHFRMSAEFTIKSKTLDGTQHLTIGTVYYDKNIKKIVFDVKFPQNETWVQQDTVLYKIRNNALLSKTGTIKMADFTIFSMALNGKLSDYGLKDSEFILSNVEKDGDNVISTWEPPKTYKDFMGKVMIMKKDDNISGIIFFNKEGEIISRQFFRKYKNVNGMLFPTEIIVEKIIDGEKFYEITTYENITVDDYKNEDKYDYKIPVQ